MKPSETKELDMPLPCGLPESKAGSLLPWGRIVRLPTQLHTFVYEDAQDPSEFKLSLTPKYPEESVPLSQDLWSRIGKSFFLLGLLGMSRAERSSVS